MVFWCGGGGGGGDQGFVVEMVFESVEDTGLFILRMVLELKSLSFAVGSWCRVASGGALYGLGWATAHPEKLKNQRL